MFFLDSRFRGNDIKNTIHTTFAYSSIMLSSALFTSPLKSTPYSSSSSIIPIGSSLTLGLSLYSSGFFAILNSNKVFKVKARLSSFSKYLAFV